MTATGDRQRGDLLAATGENPMTIDIRVDDVYPAGWTCASIAGAVTSSGTSEVTHRDRNAH